MLFQSVDNLNTALQQILNFIFAGVNSSKLFFILCLTMILSEKKNNLTTVVIIDHRSTIAQNSENIEKNDSVANTLQKFVPFCIKKKKKKKKKCTMIRTNT